MTRKFGSNTLYSLRRRYGTSADFYHTITTTDDIQTGVTNTSVIKYVIKKAIIIPITTARLAHIAGSYKNVDNYLPATEKDVDTTVIIIDKKQLPLGFNFHIDDYVITHSIVQRRQVNKRRFNIQKIDELEDGISLLITARYVRGVKLNEIFDLFINENIDFNESVTATGINGINIGIG